MATAGLVPSPLPVGTTSQVFHLLTLGPQIILCHQTFLPLPLLLHTTGMPAAWLDHVVQVTTTTKKNRSGYWSGSRILSGSPILESFKGSYRVLVGA